MTPSSTLIKQHRYSLEEKQRLVEDFLKSGNSKKDWCNEHHLSPRTLLTWRKLPAISNKEESSPTFLPLKPTLVPLASSKKSMPLTVGKVTLTLSSDFDQDFLKEVLQVLCDLC